MRKLVKIIQIYRALEVGEKRLLCNAYKSDILSECYSRVLHTSYKYGFPSLRCFTESFKVAYEYSKKVGYSGEIAVVEVCIWNDGTCTLTQDKTCFVHRLWQMKDWIDIANLANKDVAKNLNYETGDVELYNVLSYGGQKTARAYALNSMIWVIHVEKPVCYSQILTQEEIEVRRVKRCSYPSLHSIKYSFNASICDKLIDCFNKLDGSKAWIRCSKEELNQIKTELCVAE